MNKIQENIKKVAKIEQKFGLFLTLGVPLSFSFNIHSQILFISLSPALVFGGGFLLSAHSTLKGLKSDNFLTNKLFNKYNSFFNLFYEKAFNKSLLNYFSPNDSDDEALIKSLLFRLNLNITKNSIEKHSYGDSNFYSINSNNKILGHNYFSRELFDDLSKKTEQIISIIKNNNPDAFLDHNFHCQFSSSEDNLMILNLLLENEKYKPIIQKIYKEHFSDNNLLPKSILISNSIYSKTPKTPRQQDIINEHKELTPFQILTKIQDYKLSDSDILFLNNHIKNSDKNIKLIKSEMKKDYNLLKYNSPSFGEGTYPLNNIKDNSLLKIIEKNKKITPILISLFKKQEELLILTQSKTLKPIQQLISYLNAFEKTENLENLLPVKAQVKKKTIKI